MKRVLSVLGIILFFAVSFSALAFAAGFRGTSSASGRTHLGADTGAATGTSEPDISGTQTGDVDPATSGTEVSDSAPSTDVPVTSGESAEPQPVYLDALPGVISPASVEGMVMDRSTISLAERRALYDKLTANIGLYDGESVYIDASGDYAGGESRIVLLSEGLYSDAVCGTETVLRYYREDDLTDASYVTHSVEVTRFRTKIQPYMGYLIITFEETSEKGESVIRYALHAPDGRELIHDLEGKRPYYARDFSNLPLFTDGSGNLFSFNGEKFTKASYGKIRSELYYDYPATALASYNGIAEVSVLDSKGYCRFVNVVNGKNYISTKYVRAYNFSENGLAVVVNSSGQVKIINTANKSAVGSTVWKVLPGTRKTYVVYVYMPFDTYGIESIGSTGFDHGWIRVREQALSRLNNNRDFIYRDDDVLIDQNGEHFDMPDGYTLEGYSDGVLLLRSKDGYYGYYSVEGRWIARPIYTYARPFIQGLAAVGFEDGTLGMIDTEGNIVLPFVYTFLSDVSSGVVTAYNESVGWNTYLLVKDVTAPNDAETPSAGD